MMPNLGLTKGALILYIGGSVYRRDRGFKINSHLTVDVSILRGQAATFLH